MDKRAYISEDERQRCQRVADAFAELYELEHIVVMDVGRYGFVKLQYYTPERGFEDAITFTDSKSLFEDLWQEWLDTKLYLLGLDERWMIQTMRKYITNCQKRNSRNLSAVRLILQKWLEWICRYEKEAVSGRLFAMGLSDGFFSVFFLMLFLRMKHGINIFLYSFQFPYTCFEDGVVFVKLVFVCSQIFLF